LFSNFVEEEKLAFLLVWDKESYRERCLVLFSCACVFQPTLVHLCQTSSQLPSPLPIVASASLRLIYLPLYSESINHIQVFGFFPFPYSSCAHSPLCAWPMSKILLHFRSIILIRGRTCDCWPSEPD
jgi:hypothetical protein